MAGNRFGKNFTLTTFGESHGNSIGGVIDGCPAGLEIDLDQVQKELDRRRPGQSEYTTQRKESDVVEFYSGIYEGKSTGTPIGFRLMNSDTKSGDYDHLKDNFRPSHADYTYHSKYGHRDHRGGGRSSARETACRVVAGAIARQLLSGVEIRAYVESVEKIQIPHDYQALDLSLTDQSPIRCPHPATAEKIQELIARARDEGDSLGGVICCVVKGVPAGWGEPVFDKLHADLAKAMLSINAVKGFEYGSGFAGTRMRGSEHNDAYGADGELLSNFSGGIQGGISNGADIYFRTAFKPTATLLRDQSGLSKSGEAVTIEGKGRHDPCVLPRAVPIVEAMAALVLVDQMLSAKLNQHN